MSDILEIRLDGRVLRVAMNRPEKRNALNAELCAALVRTLEEADGDAAVGAILLTGNGKSFSAGMDLSEIGPAPSEELNVIHERLFTIGARMTTPVVGAINGAALGGGAGLVANCHIVVAAREATFGLTEIRLGLWPFLVYRALTGTLGDRRTAELALTGRIFGAPEAKTMGLVDEVTDRLDERALEVAKTVAAYSPTAVRSGLRFVREARNKDWTTAGEIARRIRNEVSASADFQEGVRAFLEKRTPRWPSLGKNEESRS